MVTSVNKIDLPTNHALYSDVEELLIATIEKGKMITIEFPDFLPVSTLMFPSAITDARLQNLIHTTTLRSLMQKYKELELSPRRPR